MNDVAVVEAFDTGRADFAALNAFRFVLGKGKKGDGVDPSLTIGRGDNERSHVG